MSKNTKRFTEFVKNREKQPPPLLYKYTSLDTANDILNNSTLRFSSPVKFNDPFDSQWNFLWQLSTPEFNQTIIERILYEDIEQGRFRDDNFRQWVMKSRRDHEILPAEHKIDHIKNMKEELGQGFMIPDQVSDMIKRLRILCLATTPESIQMWSYYASGHKGVVLAFYTEILERAWELPVREVKYEQDLPKIVQPEMFFDFFIYGEELPEIDHQGGSDALTLTKNEKWSHENEWRYVSIANRGDTTRYIDTPFLTSALAGLVRGCNCDRESFKELGEIAKAKYPQAIPWAVDLHPNKFALVAGKLGPLP